MGQVSADGQGPRNRDVLAGTVLRLPDTIWGPIVTGGLVLLAGVAGLVTSQPLLFPSLGPTAFLQAQTPDQPAARFWNTVVGHLVGLGAGYLSIALVGAGEAPALFATHLLDPGRALAAGIAVALTMLVSLRLRAFHPPAAATTLLVALGGFRPIWQDALAVVAGVLIVATAGELLRRVRTSAIR